MNRLRILFLAPNPIGSATTRYRVAQYLPGLAAAGIDGTLVPFLSPQLFETMYQKRQLSRKVAGILAAFRQRLLLTLRAGQFDAVFISREAMTLGPPVIEWLLANLIHLPVIFDFDDATWVEYRSPTYGNLTRFIKFPGKTRTIIKLSSAVIAGNGYLADYARQFNPNVHVIPTVVDTNLFQATLPTPHNTSHPIIGWIGSHSTSQYLSLITTALQAVAKRHRFLFRVIGAGREIRIDGVEIENLAWKMESETADFRGLDIGVYPIVTDDWSLGKCAFKAIQYQAAGVACISSPVGMTREVITDGVDGVMAATEDDWISGLERLLVDVEWRKRLASAGAQTARERYSLEVHAPRMAGIIRGVVASGGGLAR